MGGKKERRQDRKRVRMGVLERDRKRVGASFTAYRPLLDYLIISNSYMVSRTAFKQQYFARNYLVSSS